jgi:hypothetical protein
MRARALDKFSSVKTWIADLCAAPVKQRTATWVSGSARWLKRNKVAANAEAVHELLAERAVEFDSSKGAEYYFAANFQETRDYVKYFCNKRRSFNNVQLDEGMRALVAARTKGFLTAYRAAKAKMLVVDALQKCPCCGRRSRESLEHILLSCPAWASERALTIAGLLAKMPSESLTAKAKCRILLGGRALGWSFGSAWAQRVDGHRPLFLRVVKFFGAIMRRRSKLVWSWAVSPGAEAHVG